MENQITVEEGIKVFEILMRLIHEKQVIVSNTEVNHLIRSNTVNFELLSQFYSYFDVNKNNNQLSQQNTMSTHQLEEIIKEIWCYLLGLKRLV